jgi:hypothetical protein
MWALGNNLDETNFFKNLMINAIGVSLRNKTTLLILQYSPNPAVCSMDLLPAS